MLVITDWSEHYENNRTRGMKRMQWVPVPNKQDGDGYTELLDHPNGTAHYGAWMAIVLVASKQSPQSRGTLLRESGTQVRAHCAKSLARMTRVPVTVLEEAIPRLIEIGWLSEIDDGPEVVSGKEESVSGDPAPSPQEGAGKVRSARTQLTMEGKGMEGNRTERNRKKKTKAKKVLAESADLPEGWNADIALPSLRDWLDHKQSRREGYKSAKSVSILLRKFDSAESFAAAVSHSIGNNYAGCFLPNENGSGKATKPFDPTDW